jgi:hypothetical protein
MNNFDWPERFRDCWERAVEKYRQGNRDPAGYFEVADAEFLASIGASAQELYDFAEDWCVDGEPSFATALLVTAARRDFFLVVQRGRSSGRQMRLEEFPPAEAELAGFVWLPRIIAKARAKLRGQLPPQLMYCCGGDRKFLRGVNVHPADFLRAVWAARDDDQRIVEYVRAHATRSSGS